MNRMTGTAFGLAIGLLLTTGCSGENGETELNEPELAAIEADAAGMLDSPQSDRTDEGSVIPSPSDPGASYRILRISGLSNGNIEVVSRRNGSSGTSFARREINCGAYTYRYLGEGDTREEAEGNSPNPGDMSELTGTSASSDVANAACREGAN